MTLPKICYDFEFSFMSGQTLFVTAEEGRDRIAIDDLKVLIQVKPADGSMEETIVHRGALAYMRTTKREVQPDAADTEQATLRLVEGADLERRH